MTTIRILPEILSNQIAAGEVVERPSSVVKELVENSIDAGADRITIEIERGGKSLIRISDNGSGLERDDALLSIERYATSKLFSKEDLFSISTMGFRGEALPSIASVSRFSMVTRTEKSDIGTRIDMAGGKITNVSDAGAPVGTMVEVKHLFFNTPARKKFLKSDATEVGHVVDAVSGMALGHQGTGFRLFLNQRLHKNFSKADDLLARSVHVLGKDAVDKLYPLEHDDTGLQIRGVCSNPMVTRSTSAKIFLYVNNRLVYDRGLVSAIFRGYRGRVMKGRFPMGAFFIDIGFDQVDVNVHPSKKEIRFFNSQQVYTAMSAAVESALSRAQRDLPRYTGIPDKRDDAPEAVREKRAPVFEFGSGSPVDDEILRQGRPDLPGLGAETVPDAVEPDAGGDRQSGLGPKPQSGMPESDKLRIIGQVMGTYILAESGQGMVMIDQHAAHERIVYEALKKRYQSLSVQSQMLAVPEIMEFNAKEAEFILASLPDLDAMGLKIEPFGGTSFVVKAVPALIDEREIRPLLADMIDAGLVKKDRKAKTDWLDDCLILMACHTAIRANLNLNPIQIERLILDLEKCENPRHCPHGRPIMVSWNKNQIEKLFKRLV